MTETSSTINIPGTTRPEIHEDLSEYETAPHVVAKIHSEYLVRFPSMGAHLLAAIGEARALGLGSNDEGEILLPRTEAELNEALRRAQSVWDGNRDRYLRAVEDPASLTENYQRRWVDSFATSEGLPAIEWPEVSA